MFIKKTINVVTSYQKVPAKDEGLLSKEQSSNVAEISHGDASEVDTETLDEDSLPKPDGSTIPKPSLASPTAIPELASRGINFILDLRPKKEQKTAPETATESPAAESHANNVEQSSPAEEAGVEEVKSEPSQIKSWFIFPKGGKIKFPGENDDKTNTKKMCSDCAALAQRVEALEKEVESLNKSMATLMVKK